MKTRKTKKRWIQRAIKRPGRLRELARKEGALKKDGTISMEWLQQKAKSDNKSLAQAARLAIWLKRRKR